MSECQLCGKKITQPIWCPGCGALAYCGTHHLIQHRKSTHDDEECSRMQSQMQSGPQMKLQGLEFSDILAAEAHDDDHICFLLEILGVHCWGPYASLCKCFIGTDAATETNTLCILVGGAASVEVAQQACLLELLHLWGAVGRIMVALVGPGVAACKHGSVRVLDNGDKRMVEIACFRGYVHQQMDSVISFFEHRCTNPVARMSLTDPSNSIRARRSHDESEEYKCWPDIAFLPNAGLAAYTTWTHTLELLSKAQVPIVATDYCEEAMIRALSQNSIFRNTIHLNPFRSPMPAAQNGSRLPSFSNAFMCDPQLQSCLGHVQPHHPFRSSVK